MAKRTIKKRGVATTEGLETIAQSLVRLRKERGPQPQLESKWPQSPHYRERNNSSFWQLSKPSSHSTPHSEALTFTIRFQLDRTLDKAP